MNLLLEDAAPSKSAGAAERLRTTMAAVRVAFVWFGARRALTPDQKTQAADTFDAESEFLSARKKLLDSSHPAMKAVTGVRGRVLQYWRRISLPYPEPAIRLIRQDDVGALTMQLTTLRADLAEAVEHLEASYDELRSAARRRLGRLYNAGDYPATLRGMFDMSWDFPSVEPPNYLRELSPELYRQECERVESRFREAVQLAEQAFIDELSRLVSHLTERLSGADDGRPKVFRDSAIENLAEFFQRFRALNIGGSSQLEDLVAQAQRIVRGVEPQQLRDSGSLRQEIVSQLSAVQSVVDGLLVDRPRRNILRRAR